MHSIQDGIILLDKEKGKTSFQVISELKKKLSIKKIGHSGTLDKEASGLLIVGIGRSTKLLKYFIKNSKTYLADIFFGKQTSTDDSQGISVNEYNGEIDSNKIIELLPLFTGKIKQIPPDYSAIHVNGKRAYKFALKNVKPELKEREVEIYKNDIISIKPPVIKLKIKCSSGTYIRSIARDLGIKSGYYAYLYSLRRLEINSFSVEDALKIQDITAENLKIISPFEILSEMQELEIKKEFINNIKNGIKIDLKWFNNMHSDINNNSLVKIHFNKELLAVIKNNNGNFIYDLVY